LLVQWYRGRKVIIMPESHDDSGSVNFPAGWRLILAGLEKLRLNRSDDSQESLDDLESDEPDPDKR
jgi:hypothetical protein